MGEEGRIPAEHAVSHIVVPSRRRRSAILCVGLLAGVSVGVAAPSLVAVGRGGLLIGVLALLVGVGDLWFP